MKLSPAIFLKAALVVAVCELFLLFVLIADIVSTKKGMMEQLPATEVNSNLNQIQSLGKTKQFTNRIRKGQQVLIKDTILSKKYIPPNNLGWIPFWDQDAAFAAYKQNPDLLKHISLFWYGLRPDGSIRKYIYAQEDKSIISFAHSKGAKVFVLVANLPDEDDGGDWDFQRVDKVISTRAARAKHIADLVALAKRLRVDGINIDYEAMRAYQKNNFTAFIKELSGQLHKNNKLLAVALHPKIREGDPEYSNGSQAQDWTKLSLYADQLHLMTYDEHWNSSKPGPIASVSWVKSVLNYALTLIPHEKLFAGVPLYGYDWPSGGNAQGLTYQGVLAKIRTYKPKILWNNTYKSHYFNYTYGGIKHTVWFEDDTSFSAKLDLFANLKLYNLAFWRLGGEDSGVWTNLRKIY